jgi:hypothetical protein
MLPTMRVNANGAMQFEATLEFLQVQRNRLRQADDAHLGGHVVRLA